LDSNFKACDSGTGVGVKKVLGIELIGLDSANLSGSKIFD
jgi:hypothetical protein